MTLKFTWSQFVAQALTVEVLMAFEADDSRYLILVDSHVAQGSGAVQVINECKNVPEAGYSHDKTSYTDVTRRK